MGRELQIYVADLAAYNNGYLHGVWLDATEEPDVIMGYIQDMLKAGPIKDSEEYAIHDYEGFGDSGLGEYAGIQEVHDTACFIKEFPDFGSELLNYYSDCEEARSAAVECYQGSYKSLADYAEELIESTLEIPENIARYIDYERIGRDMEMSGDIFSIEKGCEEIHVFWAS